MQQQVVEVVISLEGYWQWWRLLEVPRGIVLVVEGVGSVPLKIILQEHGKKYHNIFI